MKKIINLLKKLYKKLDKNIENNLEKKFKDWKNEIRKNKKLNKEHFLSQKTNILLTYPDLIKERNVKPLKTIKKFLEKECENLFNSVHILPYYPSTSDMGFSILDYNKIEKKFGTIKNIQSISKNFFLMNDLVLNHCSKSHKWFRKFLKNDKNYEDFFIEKNLKEDFSKIIRARETPILTKFKKKRYIWTTFSKDQVDLNYNNPKVLLKMINVMIENIINQNIKIIRLDAIGYIIKDLKTTNFNHPKIHIILKILKRVIKVLNLKTLLLTEINDSQEENLKYLKKDEADLTYNFSLPPLILYSFIKQNTTKLKNYLKNNELMLNKNLLLNFTSSHDGIGLNPIKDILNEKDVNLLIKQVKKRNGKISYKKEKDKKIPYELNINFLCAITSENQSVKQMEKIFLVSQALILCLKGIPLIYIHSLIGSSNKKNPKTNRDINREKLTYTNLKKRIEQNSIFQNYLNLIKIKNKEKAFSPKAKIKFLKSSEKIVMFLRGDEDEKILCVLNFSNKKIKQKIKSKKFKNLMKNEKIEINKEIEIKPYEFLWLKFIQQ